MPTKHLYVAEGEAWIWEQMAELAAREHRSLSWAVHQAMIYYLQEVGRAAS